MTLRQLEDEMASCERLNKVKMTLESNVYW
jgi:hypothetical protein